MARLDAVRHRITVTDDELETLRLLTRGEPVDPQARAALVRAGLVDGDGTVDPLVIDLALTRAEPMIQCAVETSGPQGPTMTVVAVREETVWYADPWPQDGDDGAVVHQRDELPQLLWVLAGLLGLRRHDVPRVARPFTVPLRAVDAVVQTMALGERTWEPARTVAASQLGRLFADVAAPDRDMLLAALSYLEAACRVTVVWGPDAATDCRALAFWACGPGGYWLRTSPSEPLLDEPDPDALATFTPVSGAQVWQALADLLPTGAELRALAGGATV